MVDGAGVDRQWRTEDGWGGLEGCGGWTDGRMVSGWTIDSETVMSVLILTIMLDMRLWGPKG